MIALHISYCEGKLLLWCESEEIGNGSVLTKALLELSLSKVSNVKVDTYYVWLPSKGNKILHSNPLLGELPLSKNKTSIKSYKIDAIPLGLDELTDILIAAAESNEKGIIWGNSVKWLNNLFLMGLNIVIKELFIPVIEIKNGFGFALWKSLADEEDKRYLQRMPLPAVIKAVTKNKTEAPKHSGELVLLKTLDWIVDKLIRKQVARSISQPSIKNIHDAWLNALSSEDSLIMWNDITQVTDFANHLSQWSRQVFLVSQSPVKICFRLLEPESEKGKWKLEYLLQLKSDPGVLIPMSHLFGKKGETAKQLKQLGIESVETVLMLLGQAAGIYFELSNGEISSKKTCLELDTNQALNFLMEYADTLSVMGFAIMVPAWWKGKDKKLHLRLNADSPTMKNKAFMSLQNILNYDYSVCLGDEDLSIEELKALAGLKSSLIQIRGKWTFVDQQKINACLDYLQNRKKHEMTAQDLIQMSLGAHESEIPIENIQVSGWIGELIKKLSGSEKFTLQKQPKGFEGKLRHYQIRGYSWLEFLRQWGFGACLADDMGLGKTVQTLALIQQQHNNGDPRPVLLICPTTVINNWYKETEKFTPNLSPLVYHGPDRPKGKAFHQAISGKALLITSFGLLFRDVALFNKIEWAGIVVDEAQNIKNPNTKQSKAVRSLKADYRIALTGTPVENHVGDLWSIMNFLNPGLLGSQQSFKETFHKPITLYRDENSMLRLNKIISPFLLRRLKTDKKIIKDLPDKIESKEYCLLTKEQVSLYQAVVDEIQSQINSAEGIERKGLMLAALTRLKQVCNHPANYYQDDSDLFDRSGKLKRTLELLDEIYENKERTLIFTQYTEMGKMLQKVIQQHFGKETLFLHGGISKKKRDEMITRFQNDENAPYFFVLSLKAGGTGITLTRANNVIHYDRWWNPAVENQATDRAYRIGQNQKVQVHKLLTTGTLEEKIDELIMRKEEIADQVVGTGEKWLTEMSNSDFKSLISLNKSAIGDE